MDVKFIPLYGAQGREAMSCLLKLGDFTILLDCGWSDPYDPAVLQPLTAVLNTVDAVLLSHPDPLHLGALPHLIGSLGLAAPIYATGAVHKMGQMFLYDAYLNRHSAGEFTAFDLDAVDAAFERVTQLRYRQETALPGKGAGISITPLPAGRLLGGTVWRVTSNGEDFVYAMGFNHRRERHLAGTTLDSVFLRPALIVADAWSAGRPPSDKDRSERGLLEACVDVLRSNGSVLVPVDAAGRLLELILLFERHWAEHRLPYPLVLIGPMVHTTLEFAKSQLEWMNEALVKSFGHSKDNPFILKFLKVCGSLSELKKVPEGPKVVLATDPSLTAGPSKHLFAQWAPDPHNAVIMPLEPEAGSLGAAVLAASAQQHALPPGTTPPILQLTLARRVPLKGEELAQFREEERKRQEEEARAAAGPDGSPFAGAHADLPADMDLGPDGIFPEDSSRDSEPPASASKSPGGQAQQPTRASVTTIGHAGRDAVVRGDSGSLSGLEMDVEEGAGGCLVEGFEVPEGAVAPMFPPEDEWEAVTYDAYGAVVEHADFEASGDGFGGRLGRALASEAAAEHGLEGAEGDDVGGGAAAVEAEVPTKIESREVAVPLLAKVLRFDVDGVSDGRSVQTMLAHVAARAAVLLRGADEAKAAMASRLERDLEGLYASVIVPGNREEVDVAVPPSFEVALSEKIARAADLHAVGGYDLAWLESVMGPAEDAGKTAAEERHPGGDKAQEQVADQAPAPLPTLLPPPQGSTLAEEGATYGGVFIGVGARLSELKGALAAVGVASEFHGGALYCTGQVVVRRRDEGRGLVLEGALGDTYYKVRDVVYGQYHVC